MATATKVEPELTDYVVTAGAVTLRVGPAKDAVRRFVRGAILRLRPESATTQQLLRGASIAVFDPETPARPATVRSVVRAFGASDDPVAMPIAAVLPIPATAEQAESAR